MVEITSTDGLHHRIAGEPTLADGKNARGLLDAALAEVEAANGDSTVTKTVEVSLAGVTQSNSVLVSLMLVWMRRARRAGVGILFLDIPPLVASLIEFTGLDDVLPMVKAEAVT
jgi:ABC-type transporter Mla MlaB component